MKEAEIRTAVRKALTEVAPETEGEEIDPEVHFSEQFELDSMDFVGVVLALEKILEVKIPETDYPRLSSLRGCVKYFG